MKYIIDRFEGDIAVLEKGENEFSEVEKFTLPPDAKEGDCLIFKDGKYYKDENETKRLKTEIDALMNDLFK